MPERGEPNLDQVREAMREHDERQELVESADEDEPGREPPGEAEPGAGEGEDDGS